MAGEARQLGCQAARFVAIMTLKVFRLRVHTDQPAPLKVRDPYGFVVILHQRGQASLVRHSWKPRCRVVKDAAM